MCTFNAPRFYHPCDYKVVTITNIRLKKIHRFASDRWVNAKNLEHAKFWRSVMNWCVTTKTAHVKRSDEERQKLWAQYHNMMRNGRR